MLHLLTEVDTPALPDACESFAQPLSALSSQLAVQWPLALMNMNLAVPVRCGLCDRNVLMLATNRGFLGLQLEASARVCRSGSAVRHYDQQRNELTMKALGLWDHLWYCNAGCLPSGRRVHRVPDLIKSLVPSVHYGVTTALGLLLSGFGNDRHPIHALRCALTWTRTSFRHSVVIPALKLHLVQPFCEHSTECACCRYATVFLLQDPHLHCRMPSHATH